MFGSPWPSMRRKSISGTSMNAGVVFARTAACGLASSSCGASSWPAAVSAELDDCPGRVAGRFGWRPRSDRKARTLGGSHGEQLEAFIATVMLGVHLGRSVCRRPTPARAQSRRSILPLALAQFICSFAGSNMNVMINDISQDLGTTVQGVQIAITLPARDGRADESGRQAD